MRPIGFASKAERRPNGLLKARIIVAIVIVISAAVIFWFGNGIVKTPETRTLTVYCYTGMQEVMENAIFPAFQDYWKERHGEKLEFISTFSGSGTITKQIVAEFPAEVAILSSKLDAIQLSSYGIHFLKYRDDLPFQGSINRTPIVMLVRDKNPKEVYDFVDLGKTGIEIAYPDPHTSGAGQLGILAIFGSLVDSGASESKAYEELHLIWNNVIGEPASVRDELEGFLEGVGDVLIAYESGIFGWDPVK